MERGCGAGLASPPPAAIGAGRAGAGEAGQVVRECWTSCWEALWGEERSQDWGATVDGGGGYEEGGCVCPTGSLQPPRAHPASEQQKKHLGYLEGTSILSECSGTANQTSVADAACLAGGCSYHVAWFPWAVLPICREF